MGHEDAFPRPRLSGRSGFGQRAFAGASSNEKDAPISDSCGRGLVLIDDPHRPGATKVSTSQYDRLDGPNVQAHCETARSLSSTRVAFGRPIKLHQVSRSAYARAGGPRL